MPKKEETFCMLPARIQSCRKSQLKVGKRLMILYHTLSISAREKERDQLGQSWPQEISREGAIRGRCQWIELLYHASGVLARKKLPTCARSFSLPMKRQNIVLPIQPDSTFRVEQLHSASAQSFRTASGLNPTQ